MVVHKTCGQNIKVVVLRTPNRAPEPAILLWGILVHVAGGSWIRLLSAVANLRMSFNYNLALQWYKAAVLYDGTSTSTIYIATSEHVSWAFR